MSTSKSMEFIETPVKNPGTQSVKHIQNSQIRRQFKQMSKLRVLWVAASYLGYECRVGLLIFALVSYFAVDHFGGLQNIFYIIQGTLFG